jgi:hypothetical protein
VPSESTHNLGRSWCTRVRRFYRRAQWLGRYTFPDDPARYIGRRGDDGIGGDDGRCGGRLGSGYRDGFGVLGYVQTGMSVWTHYSRAADGGTTITRTKSAII